LRCRMSRQAARDDINPRAVDLLGRPSSSNPGLGEVLAPVPVRRWAGSRAALPAAIPLGVGSWSSAERCSWGPTTAEVRDVTIVPLSCRTQRGPSQVHVDSAPPLPESPFRHTAQIGLTRGLCFIVCSSAADSGALAVCLLRSSGSYATSILISFGFTASNLGSRTVRTPSR
jgi:hypothetical protein